MNTTQKQHSRRDILKKSAAAGAVFWAVPVIESVTSRAAAASGTVTFTCSYGIIVYQQTGTSNYFWARFSNGSTNSSGCAIGSNNGGSFGCTFDGTVNGLHVVIGSWTGTTPNITVGSTTVTSSDFSCAHLNQTGDTITANSGYTMLAAVAFGGHVCASAAVTGTAVQFIGCI
jgi:hypothetical protein